MSSSRRSGWERCTRRRRSAMTRRGGMAVVGAVRGRVGSGRARRHPRTSAYRWSRSGTGASSGVHGKSLRLIAVNRSNRILVLRRVKGRGFGHGIFQVPWPPAPSGASELACRRRRAAAQQGVLTRRLGPSQPPLDRRRLPPRAIVAYGKQLNVMWLYVVARLSGAAPGHADGSAIHHLLGGSLFKMTSSKWRRCSSRATTPPMRGHHTRPATRAS